MAAGCVLTARVSLTGRTAFKVGLPTMNNINSVCHGQSAIAATVASRLPAPLWLRAPFALKTYDDAYA